MAKKIGTPAQRRAMKKSAAKINEMRKQAPKKLYGKPVMKETAPGTKIGYASVSKTSTSKFKPEKLTTKQGRKSVRKAKKM